MARKRVLLLGPSRQTAGGVASHLNQLQGSSLSRDFDFFYFQVGSEGRQENAIRKFYRLLISPIALSVSIALHRPCIVHINASMASKSFWRDSVYLIVSKITGRKVVYQIHGGVLPKELFPRSRLLTEFLRRTLGLCDAIVLLAQKELSAYRKFVPKARLELIANAINLEGLLKEKNISLTGPLHLVYLGRLIRKKGLYELLQAIHILNKAGKQIRLTIAGGGPEGANLRKKAAELDLEESVTFIGEVFGEQKNRFWLDADVFVFPTHAEGFPYVMLESMAAGTPLITTRVGAIPDVIDDAVHGLFVTAEDPQSLAQAIACLESDRRLLARMSSAAREHVIKHYEVSRLADDFRRLYNSL